MKRALWCVILLLPLLLHPACDNKITRPRETAPPLYVGTWEYDFAVNDTSDLRYLLLREDDIYRSIYRDWETGYRWEREGEYTVDNWVLDGYGSDQLGMTVDSQRMGLSDHWGDTLWFVRDAEQKQHEDWVTRLTATAEYSLSGFQIPYSTSLTADGESIFLMLTPNGESGSQELLKLNPESGSIVRITDLVRCHGLTYAKGALWTSKLGYTIKLDPETGDSLDIIDYPFIEALNPIFIQDSTLFGYGLSALFECDLASGDVLDAHLIPRCYDLALVDGDLVANYHLQFLEIDLANDLYDKTWLAERALNGIAYINGQFFSLGDDYIDGEFVLTLFRYEEE